MIRFHVFTGRERPGLHVWRENSPLKLYLRESPQAGADGWHVFEADIDTAIPDSLNCLLFQWSENYGAQQAWEPDAHIHHVPRGADGRLASEVWLFEGAARTFGADPLAAAREAVRIHLVTAAKYIHGLAYVWNAPGFPAEPAPATGTDADGPYWDFALASRSRSFIQFKFVRPVYGGREFEGDYANRIWTARDGAEVWTHSDADTILTGPPVKRRLILHFRQEIDAAHPPRMHLWQANSDFISDSNAEADTAGWTRHQALLYDGVAYRCQFWNPTLAEPGRWEHSDAIRTLLLDADREYWTLEGDGHLFAALPVRDRRVTVTVAAEAPGQELARPLGLVVRVGRARAPLAGGDGLTFQAYPEVPMSFRVTGADGRAEPIDGHTVRVPAGAAEVRGYVVTGRPALLARPPAADLFQDPPFWIRRPGAYEEDGQLRFVLFAPTAAQAELIAEWTNWQPVALHTTRDGTYWWAQARVAQVAAGLPAAYAGDYHGARYKYVLDGLKAAPVQDPAAGWVEGSNLSGASRLVRPGAFTWRDDGWRTPSWDWLRLYQVHPARFSRRTAGAAPFDQVAHELEDPGGYLRQLNVTGLQLMPVNEVGTVNSWGYDPAFFYAVEEDYGGPDGLKRLVDACHRHGIAVLADVEFNHGATVDNILWETAHDSFFAGDTGWGAMINFSHPQVRHFFAQNLVYLLREFHLDGFRFDFTRVIVHSNDPNEAFVRRPGPGGGWEFLQALRAAAREANPGCILIAEHLPNEWAVTNFGGPMDSQWCDNFHDRLLDACAGGNPMPALADAAKLSQTACDDWYKVTNYPESHDEVGNVNGRIAYVAGFGRGLRMGKAAAAVALLSRGVPMMFMGEESGEWRQFLQGSAEALDLDSYLADENARRVRAWVNALLDLRANDSIKGPAPLAVTYAQDRILGLGRGQAGDYFAVVNFGPWSGWKPLAELNLPGGTYRELWNSTWPAFAVEAEDEHTNGGRDARLDRGAWLQVPDYGAVVLERV